MTPQELKNSILQLAIQGKLVEQRPEEGTAEELYRQIQQEKQALIKAGKIKKEKPLPDISEDEIPFEIPENWRWKRLNGIVYNRGQCTPDTKFSYIDIGSIDNEHQCLNAKENILEASEAPSRARKIVDFGDILYSTVRPYLHNMCIIDRTFSCKPIASTGFAVMTCYNGIYNRFLFLFLMSPAFDSYANDTENAKGVAYPAINDDRLYRAIVPIPPLAEQKRIVAKIEELLPYIDRYEKAWNRLEDFNKRFPADMQKSILQLAIQGKLVEQRPEEGTGEALYQQIQKEKQALIKAGKIKKEKPLPEITEDEIPFEIPESWKWVEFGTIANILGTGLIRTGSEQYKNAQYYYFKMNNIGNFDGKCIFDDMVMINATDDEYEKYKLEEGDFLFNTRNSRELVGKTAVVPRAKLKIILNNNILKIRLLGNIDPLYMNYYFISPQGRSELAEYVTSTTNVAAIYQKQLITLQVPLPPLAEQKRIVAKLEELLPLCERLK